MLPFIIAQMFYLKTVLNEVYFQINILFSITQYLFTLYIIKTLKGTVPFKVNYQYLDSGSSYCQFYSQKKIFLLHISSPIKAKNFPCKSKVENFILQMITPIFLMPIK